jgi:hypothetical protein
MAEAPQIPVINKWLVAMTVMVPTFIEVSNRQGVGAPCLQKLKEAMDSPTARNTDNSSGK